jgi:hypothetical protein
MIVVAVLGRVNVGITVGFYRSTATLVWSISCCTILRHGDDVGVEMG